MALREHLIKSWADNGGRMSLNWDARVALAGAYSAIVTSKLRETISPVASFAATAKRSTPDAPGRAV